MHPIPFRLVSGTVLATVARRLDAAARDWAVAWGIAPDALSFDCARAWDDRPPPPQQGVRWEGRCCPGEGSAWLGWQAEFLAQLQRQLFPLDATGHGLLQSKLAPDTCRRALEELLTALADSLAAGDVVDPAPQFPTALLSRGSGAVMWRLTIGRQALRVLLDAASVDTLAEPPAALAPLPRLDWREALAAVPVALRVEAGEARVGLGALASAGVGDVIRLESAVDAPVVVRTQGSAVLFNAYLGRIGGSIAVEAIKQN